MSTSKINLAEQVFGYFKGTKAAVEALTNVFEGSIGYATDTNEFGSYDGSAWLWGQGGGGTLDGLSDVLVASPQLRDVLVYDDDNERWTNITESQFKGTVPAAVSNANDIFRCDAAGASAFAGTIATLPGGATLTYNVTSGQENAMVPTSTSQLGKMRLYNTTRGTNALISNCNTGTNTITLTANVPAGWVVGDVITIASQTVSGGGLNWVDIQITSGDFVGKSFIFVFLSFADSGGAGQVLVIHPFESFAVSKYIFVSTPAAAISANSVYPYKLTSNIITLSWTASGAATATPVLRQVAYIK